MSEDTATCRRILGEVARLTPLAQEHFHERLAICLEGASPTDTVEGAYLIAFREARAADRFVAPARQSAFPL